MKRPIALMAVFAAVLFGGMACGGSGGGGVPDTAVKFSIEWPERSSRVAAPSSALSFRLTLIPVTKAPGRTTDFQFDGARNRDLTAAHTENYTTVLKTQPGEYDAQFRFFGGEAQALPVVGVASGRVTIAADGTGIGTLTHSQTIEKVDLVAGQTVQVGEKKLLTAIVKDSDNNLVVVSPGSFVFTSSDASVLRFEAGEAVGVSAGQANVTVTIDEETDQSLVTVLGPVPDVAITPETPTCYAGTWLKFSAVVGNETSQAVTWQITDATASGTVDADGLYVLPAEADPLDTTDTLKATSVANPAKSATVVIQLKPWTGNVQTIFNNWNIAGVDNGGSSPSFTITVPHAIAQIHNYHWNYGSGSVPGTIALQAGDGTTYGPWQAAGANGQGGVTNASWIVSPAGLVLPAGTYTVIDSEPSTWAQNGGSGGLGFSAVYGEPQT